MAGIPRKIKGRIQTNIDSALMSTGQIRKLLSHSLTLSALATSCRIEYKFPVIEKGELINGKKEK